MNLIIAFCIALFLSALVVFFYFAGDKVDPSKFPDWITSLPDTCWVQTNSRPFPGQKREKIEIRFGKKFLDNGSLSIFYRPKGSKSTGSTIGYFKNGTFVHGKQNVGLPEISVSWDAKSETLLFKDAELSYIFTRMAHWFTKTK